MVWWRDVNIKRNGWVNAWGERVLFWCMRYWYQVLCEPTTYITIETFFHFTVEGAVTPTGWISRPDSARHRMHGWKSIHGIIYIKVEPTIDRQEETSNWCMMRLLTFKIKNWMKKKYRSHVIIALTHPEMFCCCVLLLLFLSRGFVAFCFEWM